MLKVAELMRAYDTLLLSGRTSFLGNMKYWAGVPNDSNATVIRQEIAQLQKNMQKVFVSDKITKEELAPGRKIRALLDWRMHIRRSPRSNSSPVGIS